MSRKNLPRAEDDLYARHPVRIVRALRTGELDPHGYLILKLFVDELEAPGSHNGEAIYTLEELGRLIGWPLTLERLRQKLHELRRDRWIMFPDLQPGQRRPWIFCLDRAAIDGDLQATSKSPPPLDLEVTSNSAHAEEAANPQPERPSEEIRPPTASVPRAERSGAETENLSSKGRKEKDVGKTTAAATDPAITDRLIALVRGEPPVQVEQAHDGSLAWSAEPVDGEQGVLADVQALVDAGLAEWVEDDAEGER